ncbi:MAG: hypothetical protein LBS25_03155 [Candidatus Symbiothrix sp.]|jgi:hypothetical protein|nr:hypothetical protein [Candidatus Symbiothrix sp.]
MNYESIKQTANEIILGFRQIYRLGAEGERGRIVEFMRYNFVSSCQRGLLHKLGFVIYEKANYQLPFGCHGWLKYEYDSFGKQYIALIKQAL